MTGVSEVAERYNLPAFPPWLPTFLRRRKLQAELATETGIWRQGALMDALANEQRRIRLRILLEPRDMWLGLYWDHPVRGWDGGWWEGWEFYLCLLPCLPLLLTINRSNRNTRRYRRWKRAIEEGR